VYFIMITLAFAQMLYFLGVSLKAYGGDDGMTVASRSRFGGLVDLENPVAFHYLVLALLVGFHYLAYRLVRSRFGMVIQGCRSNERRMRAIGFPPLRYQLTAFVLAGAMCGIAGVLLVNFTKYMSPAYMHWTRSGEIMVMVILGGMGTVLGPALGAFAYLALEEVLAGYTEYWPVVLGPFLVAVVLFARRGLYGLVDGGDLRRGCAPAGDPRAPEALRRRDRHRPRRPHGRARRDPCPHRPQRRRQDDARRPARGGARARRRHHPLRGGRRHWTARARARGARVGAL